MLTRACWVAVGFVAALGVADPAPAKVTFESLVTEMTDLEALTYFPDPAYTVKQFSSYDRNSRNPSVLTDDNWFANGDRGQHLRVEERNGAQEWVMMDATGPGAIVRIWSANPLDAGVVRVYLDGAETPVIEMALSDILGGADTFPFVKPISHEAARGWNTYLPIPYAKHCKVTASKPGFYYQINYRTYESGTNVETYSAKGAKKSEESVREVAQVLATPAAHIDSSSDSKYEKEFNLATESSAAMSIVSEASAIHALLCKVESENLEDALRQTVIEFTFDDAGLSNVSAPIGDFFGTAPGINRYQSLNSGVLEDGSLYAAWVMPFQKKCEIRLRNLGASRVKAVLSAQARSYRWTNDSMYFNAGFRSEYPIATQPRQDWTFLETTGKGRFVGTMLHITNPVKAWWGEGDEKIYVDGETFPSHFGTGTEDYFGYAWCDPTLFTHAYHNQPRCDGPGNYGQTCVSRFHIIDNIPYTKSFKFDMEVWHWAECEVAMAETAYWYEMPGGTNKFAALTVEDLKVIEPAPLPPPRKVEGALEGESLRVIAFAGKVEPQVFTDDIWSGSTQLWWTQAKVGDELRLGFPVDEAGTYEVFAVFTKAGDYGIHFITINGHDTASEIDFYNNGVMATTEMSIGVFSLRKGENTITVSATGANEKAVKSYMFGLDYLRLVKK